jgi:ATP synthase C subunit
MTSAIRFAAAHARMHALKSRLWTPLDRQLVTGAGVAPDGRAIAGTPEDIYPGLVRWYATYLRIYPSAGPLVRALFRRHEAENLKLLWRAALRDRVAPAECWRPLAPLATLTRPARVLTPQELVQQVERTPYGEIARALLRSHAGDLPATEIGLDRWVWSAIVEEAVQLPIEEAAASRLVRLLAIEHDADLLRRGVSLGLEPDLVAKSTVVLSRECRIGVLSAVAAWRDGDGPLARVLPPPLARVLREGSDLDFRIENRDPTPAWDGVVRALRRARLRECRRAFVGWPFRLAPALAALLLREEQARAMSSVAAARARGGRALDRLPLALAASPLET